MRKGHLLGLCMITGCASRAAGELPDAASGGPDSAAATGRRPLVLVHGLDGFDEIGPIAYFHGVADALRADGVDVRVPALDPYNGSDVRGAQLLAFVAAIGEPVDLVCHSQGGLDCRYVASEAPELVDTVVTIASPHRGTPLADIAVEAVDGPAEDAMHAMLELLGAAISGSPDQDAEAALYDLSTEGAAAFAARHPDAPGVAYFSLTGQSGLTSGDGDCQPDAPAPFVTRWGAGDPMDVVLDASAVILDGALDGADAHDGLVPVASARWGTFLGCLPADHMDEICQIAGDTPGVGNDFDCVAFYRDLAFWLATRVETW